MEVEPDQFAHRHAGRPTPADFDGASGRLFAGRLGITEEKLREEFDQFRWTRTISFDSYLREVNRGRRHG